MNAGESLRDQVGQEASVRPQKHGPGVQSRRVGAPRGVRVLRKDARRASQARNVGVPFGAPLPRFGEEIRRAPPAPDKEYGGRSVG